MTVKAVLFICAQALLIQCFKAQCTGAYNRIAAAPISAAPCTGGQYARPSPNCAGWDSSQAGSYGLGTSYSAAFAASNGGGLSTSSSSPYAPNGISVLSENSIEGLLDVYGALPFLGTVALEGILPTAGSGAVAFGSGNGEVGILSEDTSSAGSEFRKGALGYGARGLGYDAGALGCGGNWAGSSYNYYGNANIGRGACGCGARAY